MKTYKTIIEKPRLEVFHDEWAENPRNNDVSLGYFITCEKNHQSPDENEDMEFIIRDTGEGADNQEQHMERIKERFMDDLNEKVVYITPVYKYEHGGVVYRRGNASGFDYSNCGFYIVTNKTIKEYGLRTNKADKFNPIIDSELDDYTAWANGEVYGFILRDAKGEVIDECGGYNDLEGLQMDLPKEWHKENILDYLKQ